MHTHPGFCVLAGRVLAFLALVIFLVGPAASATDSDVGRGMVFDPDDPFWQLLRSDAFSQFDQKPELAGLDRVTTTDRTDRDRDWTILFYDDADFENAFDPLGELTNDAFSTDNLDVVVLQDRNDGPGLLWHIAGDGVRTQLESWGEVDMGDYATLRDFIQWGKENYPADRYMLCLYDHGGGHAGACIDITNEVTTILTMDDFKAAITETGGVDIINFTAPCLMGAVESVYELKDCVDVYIGSQELSGFGLWFGALDDMCLLLDDSDALTNEDIAAQIIDILAVTPHSMSGWTISATSSARIGALVQRIDELAGYLADRTTATYLQIEEARDTTWHMGHSYMPNYDRVDLWSTFSRLQVYSDDPYVDAKCGEIIDALEAALINEWHSDDQPGAHGLSIYYPHVEPYYYDSYHNSTLDFSADTMWDEFLRAYLAGYYQPVSGIVTDNVTGLPLADVTVTVAGTSRQATTAADGSYTVESYIGDRDLVFSSFYYEDVEVPVQVAYGTPATCSVALTWLPQVTLVGRVTDRSGGVLAGVRCTPVNDNLMPTVTDAFGKFTITGVPFGTELGYTFDGLPRYGADFVHLTAEDSGPGIWPLHSQLADATYTFQWWYENFQLDGNWTHGRPTVGPGTAFSDTTCLGIGLDGGGLPDDGVFHLTSPSAVNYSGNSELYLSFHYWCDLQENVDGVKLQYKIQPDPWFDIAPIGGYSHDHVDALDGPGWSGDSGGWRSAVFDIGDYTEDFVLYRWVLISDAAENDGFFLIDDVTLDAGDTASPVGNDAALPGVFAPRLSVRPNPFNPTTTVRWIIDQPGRLSLKVYDARGRLVRTLHDGPVADTRGESIFDGRDDRGRGLASGTYLVRAGDARGRTTTTRISLIK